MQNVVLDKTSYFQQTTAPFYTSPFHSSMSILTKMLVQPKEIHTFADMAPTAISVCPFVPNESRSGKMLEENDEVKFNKTVWHDEVKGEHDC